MGKTRWRLNSIAGIKSRVDIVQRQQTSDAEQERYECRIRLSIMIKDQRDQASPADHLAVRCCKLATGTIHGILKQDELLKGCHFMLVRPLAVAVAVPRHAETAARRQNAPECRRGALTRLVSG